MLRFPFMPFPYYRVNPKYNNYNNNLMPKHIQYNYPPINPNNLNNFSNPSIHSNCSNSSTSSACENLGKNKSNSNNDDYLFDLFGLKLYFDDILIVSLLYFLYSQGVKDEGLFIVLILLLLT